MFVSMGDNQVGIWRCVTGQRLHTIEKKDVLRAAVRGDLIVLIRLHRGAQDVQNVRDYPREEIPQPSQKLCRGYVVVLQLG